MALGRERRPRAGRRGDWAGHKVVGYGDMGIWGAWGSLGELEAEC